MPDGGIERFLLPDLEVRFMHLSLKDPIFLRLTWKTPPLDPKDPAVSMCDIP